MRLRRWISTGFLRARRWCTRTRVFVPRAGAVRQVAGVDALARATKSIDAGETRRRGWEELEDRGCIIACMRNAAAACWRVGDGGGERDWVRAHAALTRLARERAAADAEEGRWLLIA